MATTTQAQVTKAKPAAAKGAASKAAPKAAQAKKPITHIIQDYARPVAGRRLFAFTAAWLELSGLQSGKTATRETLIKIAGETAIAYHTRKGNFKVEKTGLALTAKGLNFFGARKLANEYDEKIKEVFAGILTTGKADGNEVKDSKAIVKLA